MNQRNYARSTGILFNTATVAGLMSAILLGPALEGNNNIVNVASKDYYIFFVVLFEMIMALSVALIPISMYPVLKKYNSDFILGAIAFSIIESIFFIVGALFLLSLFSISKNFVNLNANGIQPLPIQVSKPWTLGNYYLFTLGNGFNSNLPWIIGGIAFTIGASLYYLAFYQSKIIPRWLSIFGLLAVILTFSAYFLQLINFNISELETLLNLPIFIQEMVLAFWLLFKGYNLEQPSKSIMIENIKHSNITLNQ